METATAYSPLGIVALTDPEAARKRITEAFRKAKAHREDAASLLSIDPTTVRRMCIRLGLRPVLDKLEEQARREGWHHGKRGGWPKGKPRAKAPKKKARGRRSP
jgi:hypothetical protein